MSQPSKRGGRGGAAGAGRKAVGLAGNTPEDSVNASERATPASKADSDPKDDSSSNGKDEACTAPKPPSAGASIRETANKVLALAMKSEWTPIEAELKKLEKYVANAGEDGYHTPLLGVADPVSNEWFWVGGKLTLYVHIVDIMLGIKFE